MEWETYRNIVKPRIYYSTNDGIIGERECHSSVFDCGKNTLVKNYYSYKNICYSKEEISDYVNLLNDCEFPMKIVYETEKFFGTPYSQSKSELFDFHIIVDRKDYISNVHFNAALTLQRMVCYRIMEGLQNVIQNAILLYKDKKEDPYICLTKSFPQITDTYICNHNFMGAAGVTIKITTKEEFLIKLKTMNCRTIKHIHT